MTRAERVEEMLLEGIPPEHHEIAKVEIQKTLSWQHAKFVDLCVELGRAIVAAFKPSRAP